MIRIKIKFWAGVLFFWFYVRSGLYFFWSRVLQWLLDGGCFFVKSARNRNEHFVWKYQSYNRLIDFVAHFCTPVRISDLTGIFSVPKRLISPIRVQKWITVSNCDNQGLGGRIPEGHDYVLYLARAINALKEGTILIQDHEVLNVSVLVVSWMDPNGHYQSNRVCLLRCRYRFTSLADYTDQLIQKKTLNYLDLHSFLSVDDFYFFMTLQDQAAICTGDRNGRFITIRSVVRYICGPDGVNIGWACCNLDCVANQTNKGREQP